jgi:hypothetical protein
MLSIFLFRKVALALTVNFGCCLIRTAFLVIFRFFSLTLPKVVFCLYHSLYLLSLSLLRILPLYSQVVGGDYGVLWFAWSDFVPRGITSFAFLHLMASRPNQQRSRSSAFNTEISVTHNPWERDVCVSYIYVYIYRGRCWEGREREWEGFFIYKIY